VLDAARRARDPTAPTALVDPGLVLVRGPGSSGLLDERKGWIMSVKLTDVQLVMMSAAGQRHDRCLAAPETMKGAALSKARENGRRMDKRSMAGFDPARSADWLFVRKEALVSSSDGAARAHHPTAPIGTDRSGARPGEGLGIGRASGMTGRVGS
jgi:hypothetical protein